MDSNGLCLFEHGNGESVSGVEPLKRLSPSYTDLLSSFSSVICAGIRFSEIPAQRNEITNRWTYARIRAKLEFIRRVPNTNSHARSRISNTTKQFVLLDTIPNTQSIFSYSDDIDNNKIYFIASNPLESFCLPENEMLVYARMPLRLH